MPQTADEKRTIIVTGQSDAKRLVYSTLAGLQDAPALSIFTRRQVNETTSVGLVGNIAEPEGHFGLKSAWHKEDIAQKSMPVIIAIDSAKISEKDLSDKIAYAKRCVPVGSEAEIFLVSRVPIKDKKRLDGFCQSANVFNLGYVDLKQREQVQRFKERVFSHEPAKDKSSLLPSEKPAQRTFSFKGLFFSSGSKKQSKPKSNVEMLDCPLNGGEISTTKKSKEVIAASIMLGLSVIVPPLSLVGLGMLWRRKRSTLKKKAAPQEPGVPTFSA